MEDNINIDDVLVEISDEDLPELAELYAGQRELMPQAYTHILTGIEWRQKGRKREIRFFSPSSCWREDGTFVTIVKCSPDAYTIVIFSMAESKEKIYEALSSTNRIPYEPPTKRVTFFALNTEFREPVVRALSDKKHHFVDRPNDMVVIRKNDAEKLNIKIPLELYVKKIDTSFVSMINSIWPPRYNGSEKFLEAQIELNECYGLFLKSNDEIVAWCLITILGQIGTLQTATNHRRKGYASILALFMAKEIAKKGFDAFASIGETNEASLSMFRKIGFKYLGKCHYLLVDLQ